MRLVGRLRAVSVLGARFALDERERCAALGTPPLCHAMCCASLLSRAMASQPGAAAWQWRRLGVHVKPGTRLGFRFTRSA
jgi:hypothetical protein